MLGAVLGDVSSNGHAYHSRGRYLPGQVIFQAAPEVDTLEEEESTEVVYDNFRTIRFTGVAGHEYQLRPLPVPGSGVLIGGVSLRGEYQGYDVLNLTTGVLVAKIP